VLEVFEAGPRAVVATMPRTGQALGGIPGQLGRIAASAAEIERDGSLATPMPER
jgi:hypothetical protein